MRDYTHNSSPVIDKIEAKFTEEYQKKYDIPHLHDLYEEVRYHFQSAAAVYKAMLKEHYRYDDITDVLSEEEFTEWYNEMLRINAPIIEVGMPCTIYYYTDHRAATVTKVEYYKDGRKDAAGNRIPRVICTNLNEVKCLDYYAGHYDVIPMTGDALKEVHDTFTIRKHGHWVMAGQQIHDGCHLGIGYWNHYIDPSF